MPVEIEYPVGARWNGFASRNGVEDQRRLLAAFSILPVAHFEPFLTRIPDEAAAIEEGICHPLLQALITAFQRNQRLPADGVVHRDSPALLRLNELLLPPSKQAPVVKQPRRRRIPATGDVFPFNCDGANAADDGGPADCAD